MLVIQCYSVVFSVKCYSVQPKGKILVKGLSFAKYLTKNIGKSVSKNLSRK